MRTVYTQDDAADLKRLGQAHRDKHLVYVTPVNGVDVEVEGADKVAGEIVAVASNGSTVWALNAHGLGNLQRAKRPAAVNPTAKAPKK